jgi:hypothetical protein
MVKHKDERKWWKITQPMDQEQNGVRYFELTKESRKYEDFNSWEGESLNKCDIRNLELLSDYKIGKLEDYAKSDLYEVFSDRFCQMLNQIGVNNIEYYPLTVTCNGRKESSSTYYKLANIVGRVKDICFYDAKRGIDCSSTEDLKSRILKNRIYAITKNREKIISPSILQSKKEALEIIEEKILRYDQERMRVPYLIVDNDIKEACEANSITGISFDEEVILTMLPVN